MALPRTNQRELLDDAGHDPVELALNLRDIRRVNRLLGGSSTTLRHLPELFADIPPDQTLSVLDLATGSADIPIALADWAAREGRRVEIIASDYSEEILAIARDHLANHPGIALRKDDARDVSMPDGSVDIVLCSLSLHHFDPDDAVRVLGEMRRLARIGFILNDLRRSRVGYAAAWVAAHATTRNRLTRNDAPLSVRRAYSPVELQDLLRQAGVGSARITTHRWFRMAAVSRTTMAES